MSATKGDSITDDHRLAPLGRSLTWRNVKHEDVYLKGYATMTELTAGLTEYFDFYNDERPHQSLGHKKPDIVYRTAQREAAH
jgi:hypothetical protein